jgi:hypothetical protein
VINEVSNELKLWRRTKFEIFRIFLDFWSHNGKKQLFSVQTVEFILNSQILIQIDQS